jgi:hypothetical protein
MLQRLPFVDFGGIDAGYFEVVVFLVEVDFDEPWFHFVDRVVGDGLCNVVFGS